MADLNKMLDAIEKLARAATPGPWKRGPLGGVFIDTEPNGYGVASCYNNSGAMRNAINNEAFIAVANPAVVLTLIAHLRAARSAVPAQAEAAEVEPGFVMVPGLTHPQPAPDESGENLSDEDQAALEWLHASEPPTAKAAAQPQAQGEHSAGVGDGALALTLLRDVFDAWENGTPCYESPDDGAGYLGTAFRMPDETFHACCDLLNRKFPAGFNAATAQGDGEHSGRVGKCVWTLDDWDNGIWTSTCGEAWSFVDGGPVENRVSFCHHCGTSVEVAAAHKAQQERGQ